MHIHKLTVEGLMTYKTQQSLDFDSLPEGVYKLQGPNGAGKSSLLECIHAALYGSWISRPDLLQNSVNKDCSAGKIELFFTLDGLISYRSVIQVERGKTPEGYLFIGDKPLVRGKISEHSKYIEANILPRSIFLSCLYRAQNNEGNFLELSASRRKEMMNRLLGQEYLEDISKKARIQMEPLEAEITSLKASIKAKEDILTGILSAEELNKQITQNQTALEASNEGVTRYQAELDTLNRQLGEIQSQKAAYNKAASSVNELVSEVQAALDAVTSLENRQLQYKSVIDTEADVNEQAETIAQLRKNLQGAKSKTPEFQSKVDSLKDKLNNIQLLRGQSFSDWEAAKQELLIAQKSINLLESVPCHEDLHDKCQFISQAALQAKSINALEEKVTSLQKEYEAFVDLSAEQRAIEGAQSDLTINKSLIEGIEKQLLTAPDNDKALVDIENAKENLKQVESEIPLASERLIKANKALSEAKEIKAPPSDAEVLQKIGQTTIQKQQAEAETKRLLSVIAGLESSTQTRQKISTELQQLESDYEGKAKELNEWGLLHQAFGKNGIQAVEIDAAGPAITDIANNLLHQCYGNRFSIKFVTTQPLKSRAGEKEVYEVMVYDNEHDREAKVESLSGGERVSVSVAIQMAIAVYLNQKSGILAKQIVLDECLGALTEENAAQAVQMLRQVLILMGLKHILIVAHLDALGDYVDGGIQVSNGEVQIL